MNYSWFYLCYLQLITVKKYQLNCIKLSSFSFTGFTNDCFPQTISGQINISFYIYPSPKQKLSAFENLIFRRRNIYSNSNLFNREISCIKAVVIGSGLFN